MEVGGAGRPTAASPINEEYRTLALEQKASIESKVSKCSPSKILFLNC
jgi:hypothetical protein